MDMKLEAMACYLTNQRPKSRGTDHEAPLGQQCLGLGFWRDVVRWLSNAMGAVDGG